MSASTTVIPSADGTFHVEPYHENVACAGPSAPKCQQIDELIRLLVTIRDRFGNTCVKYRVQWGATAMHATDNDKQTIDRLRKRVKKLREELKCKK